MKNYKCYNLKIRIKCISPLTKVHFYNINDINKNNHTRISLIFKQKETIPI